MLLFCFALASRINIGGICLLAYKSSNIAIQSQNWKHPKIKTVRLIDRYHHRNAKALVVDKLWQSLPNDNMARCLAYHDPTNEGSQICEPRLVPDETAVLGQAVSEWGWDFIDSSADEKRRQVIEMLGGKGLCPETTCQSKSNEELVQLCAIPAAFMAVKIDETPAGKSPPALACGRWAFDCLMNGVFPRTQIGDEGLLGPLLMTLGQHLQYPTRIPRPNAEIRLQWCLKHKGWKTTGQLNSMSLDDVRNAAVSGLAADGSCSESCDKMSNEELARLCYY